MQLEQERISSPVILKEHWLDLDWIIHNLIVFAPAAEAGHREFGRGALIADTYTGHESETCPFVYFSQEELARLNDDNINQKIAAYDPLEELVIILLKTEQLPRSYRVRTVPDGY
jgi:hypothetical protein